MKEIVSMWKYSMMVAITVLCAGIYMLFLLPTKSIAIIPGITEIRPASLLPVVFGLYSARQAHGALPSGTWEEIFSVPSLRGLCSDLSGTFSMLTYRTGFGIT